MSGVNPAPIASSSSSSAPSSASSSSSSTSVGGVPVEFGQPIHANVKKQLQRQINLIVGWNELDRAPMAFGQPLLRGNELQMLDHPYFVCEKSVGVRFLAVLVHGRCYLVSPNYEIREVVLFCPVRPDRLQPGVDRNTIVPHQWTILDGELVCDKDPQKSTFAFLIYDILALNGSNVMAPKLPDRLKLIQNDVVGPRKSIPLPKGHPPEPFQLVLQSMYPTNRLTHVTRTILPRVSQTRQNAGLAFIPVALPYTPCYAKGLFYWTPLSLLSVDFQLNVEWRGRPLKPGFKLMVHEKRTPAFYDWITFSTEDYDLFRNDKKASSRVIECVYDSEWFTFIPSHDKTTWDGGNPEFNATSMGVGWRKGGWKYVRTRVDKNYPYERGIVSVVEKAITEPLQLDEVEHLFTEGSKKPPAALPKTRPEPGSVPSDEFPSNKKKRQGPGPGTGVCYDFQNKGVCQRGRFCHFSHCACNSTCSCTPSKNTYGQRPSYRRNDYDAPPSPDTSVADSLLGSTRGTEVDGLPEEEEAGELVDSGSVHLSALHTPLENFDRQTIAAKRAQLCALGNRRIWASLGILEDKAPRRRISGLIVSKNGDITFVRPLDK